MHTPKGLRLGELCYYGLSLADLGTTLVALHYGGTEANPLIAWLAPQLGVLLAIAVIKGQNMALMGIVAVGARWLSRRTDDIFWLQTFRTAIWVAAGIVAIAVVNNGWMLLAYWF